MVTPFQGIGGTSLQGSVTYVLRICVTDVLRRFCYLCPGVVQSLTSLRAPKPSDLTNPLLHDAFQGVASSFNVPHVGKRGETSYLRNPPQQTRRIVDLHRY